MHPMLNIAVRAARNAGNVIARAFEQTDNVQIESKSANDFVTNVDREAEQVIIDTIRRSYPEHQFICEESGMSEGPQSDFVWIVDPLDGTTNFMRGVPHFAVSIALQVKGRIEQAVIFDPIRNELFTASRGSGVQLNGYRLRCKQARDLQGTVLATGFPFKQKHQLDTFHNIFKAFFADVADMRRAGSAALDMAYVAAGRLDGYWEMGVKPWDIAAGDLMVREAGGITCDFIGGNTHLERGNVVAGSPKVVKAMLTQMRPHLTPSLSQQ